MDAVLIAAILESQVITLATSARLGSSSHIERDEQQEVFSKLVDAPIMRMCAASVSFNDAEAARRSRNSISISFNRAIQKQKRVPWIDSLPNNYPNRLEIISKYLEKTGRTDVCPPAWIDYRVATSLFIREKYEEHYWTTDQIDRLLSEMAEIEAEILRRQRNTVRIDFEDS